ncbi:class I heat shock protein [Sesamum alatum]|uniref:Class I heat shock protein n=1 Tax=Sesamum alatum TaxID=300844 RepID=A0AAE1Y7P2_9LAMI|nr:class I heat shock protein [Sesamum alatum]
MSTVAKSVDHRTETKLRESSANPYKEACSFNQIPQQKIQTSLHNNNNNHLNRSAKFLQKAKMSLIPSFFGTRWSNVLDLLSLDIWDPFEGCPFLGIPFLNRCRQSPILHRRNYRRRRRSRGLERDAGGPRVQGGRSWDEERRSEGGG